MNDQLIKTIKLRMIKDNYMNNFTHYDLPKHNYNIALTLDTRNDSRKQHKLAYNF